MSAGFTLIELLVVMVIIGVVTALLMVAYPNIREGQKLRLAEQQLQAAFREAQQAAINEERHNACLAWSASDLSLQKHCSNIGVVLAGGEMILFADVNDLSSNGWDPGQDFEIKRVAFPAGVTVDPVSTSVFVFEATPPTVTLFVGSTPIAAPQAVTLRSGNSVANYTIHSYGQVQRN